MLAQLVSQLVKLYIYQYKYVNTKHNINTYSYKLIKNMNFLQKYNKIFLILAEPPPSA